jgi:GNAT superfamily N-acetyltransferase
MSILRSYWNLGVGSWMLVYLIEWARLTDATRKINLRVRVDNLPAILTMHIPLIFLGEREARSLPLAP